MLVSDVVRRVRSLMGDEAGTIVDNDDMFDLINDAQLEINLETKSLLATAPVINTVAGTNLYALPADFLQVVNFSFVAAGNTSFLEPISRAWLDKKDPYWANTLTRGIPRYFFTDGLDLGLYPTPDAVYAGTLRYVKMPTVVTAVGDALTLPAWLQPLVARMCFAIMKERDEDFEAAQLIKNEVFMKVNYLKSKVNDAAFSTYQTIQDSELVSAYDYE